MPVVAGHAADPKGTKMRWTPVEARDGLPVTRSETRTTMNTASSAAFLAGRVFTIPERSAGSVIESTSLMDAAARRLSRSTPDIVNSTADASRSLSLTWYRSARRAILVMDGRKDIAGTTFLLTRITRRTMPRIRRIVLRNEGSRSM